jgi:hypothetical protein
MNLRVRAVRLGYYDHLRRREGVIFSITREAIKKGKDGKSMLPSWTELVDPLPEGKSLDDLLDGKVLASARKSGKGKPQKVVETIDDATDSVAGGPTSDEAVI